MLADKRKVFIVDDDLSVRRALGILLRTYEFIVETFSSAEEFFSAVPSSLAGCLVLDVHMPILDGWGTLKRLQASGSTRSVIMITAEKNNGVEQRALDAGAMGFLQKPFNDQELVALINQSFLERRSIC